MMPAIPSEAILDVNVLIAVVFADHPSHSVARGFLGQLQRFHTTPTTQGGFLRFATRPWKDQLQQRQFPPRLSMPDALTTLEKVTAVPGHIFTADNIDYLTLARRSLTGHRQWTDAYLIHLARKHGIALASFDAGISSLEDPGSPVLHVL